MYSLLTLAPMTLCSYSSSGLLWVTYYHHQITSCFSYVLRLWDSLLIYVQEKILPPFSLCTIQACMRLTLPLKKVALTCNSCTGWVSRAGNSIAVNSRVRSTDFSVSYFLLEEHLTVYYTVFEFYEDSRRAAWRVFTKTTYHFWYMPRFSHLVAVHKN